MLWRWRMRPAGGAGCWIARCSTQLKPVCVCAGSGALQRRRAAVPHPWRAALLGADGRFVPAGSAAHGCSGVWVQLGALSGAGGIAQPLAVVVQQPTSTVTSSCTAAAVVMHHAPLHAALHCQAIPPAASNVLILSLPVAAVPCQAHHPPRRQTGERERLLWCHVDEHAD